MVSRTLPLAKRVCGFQLLAPLNVCLYKAEQHGQDTRSAPHFEIPDSLAVWGPHLGGVQGVPILSGRASNESGVSHILHEVSTHSKCIFATVITFSDNLVNLAPKKLFQLKLHGVLNLQIGVGQPETKLSFLKKEIHLALHLILRLAKTQKGACLY